MKPSHEDVMSVWTCAYVTYRVRAWEMMYISEVELWKVLMILMKENSQRIWWHFSINFCHPWMVHIEAFWDVFQSVGLKHLKGVELCYAPSLKWDSEACHTHVYDHHLHFYAHFMLIISISMWCVTVLIQWDIRDYNDHLDELTLVLKELYDKNTEWWSTDELWRCSGFEWSWVNNSDRNNDNNNRWILELFVHSHVSGLVHERAVPKLMVFKQVVHQPMSLRWNQPQQQLLRRNTPIYVGGYAELLNYLAIEWSG